jgi:hypothetical protein
MAVIDSKRELIAADIVDTLSNNTVDATKSITIKKVTREPVIIEDLAVTALPLVFVESANETREDFTNSARLGTIEFLLHLYIKGNTRDSDRNSILDTIEQALTADITRNGQAFDTQVVDIDLINSGEAAPYASLAVTVEVRYCY